MLIPTTINEDHVKHIKESHSGGTTKLLADINGNSKYMAMSEIIMPYDRFYCSDGIPLALQLEIVQAKEILCIV